MWSSIKNLLSSTSQRAKSNNNNTSSSPVIDADSDADSASLPSSNIGIPKQDDVPSTDNSFSKSSTQNTTHNNTLPKHQDDVIKNDATNNNDVVNSSINRSRLLMKMEAVDIDGVKVDRSEEDLYKEVGIKQEGTQQNIIDESEGSFIHRDSSYYYGDNAGVPFNAEGTRARNYPARSSSSRGYASSSSSSNRGYASAHIGGRHQTPSSPRRSMSTTYAHSLEKHTPGRSKALRSESGKVNTSTNTSKKSHVVHSNNGRYDGQYNLQHNDQLQHHQQHYYPYLSQQNMQQQYHNQYRPSHHMPTNCHIRYTSDECYTCPIDYMFTRYTDRRR